MIGSIDPSLEKNAVFYPYHYEYVTRANKKLQIVTKENKKYLYDALLGNSKQDRIDLFKRLENYDLINDGILNIVKYEKTKNSIFYESPDLRKYDSSAINSTKITDYWQSMVPVYSEETKSKVIASQIIPRKIYENSWISLISETFPNLSPDVPDDVFFPTEKTGKALAGGRIFLVSANQGFLKELRNLGFKTFSDYIDESYDELETYQERNEAIVKELKRLQEEVDMYDLHQKLLPVLQHNQDLIYSGKLQNRARLEVVKYIKRYS